MLYIITMRRWVDTRGVRREDLGADPLAVGAGLVVEFGETSHLVNEEESSVNQGEV
jgi:hypothetical protein